jgi:spore maturation protein CgeB
LRILFAVPGEYRTVPISRFAHVALERMGHEVVLADCSPSLQERLLGRLRGEAAGEQLVAPRLMAALEEAKPDLFLTLSGFNVAAHVLTLLRDRGVPRLNWWLNDPLQFERACRILPAYDFAFTNAKYSVDAYRARGIRNVRFLPTACDPSVHRPLVPDPSLACEISFAGDWCESRERIIAGLVEAKICQVSIFGPWHNKLPRNSPLRPRLRSGFFSPEQMVRIFASSRATLNIHAWYGRYDYGLNPRVFEAAACGVPQLVDEKRELRELVPADKLYCLLAYRDETELHAQVRAVLADPRAARQRAMQLVSHFHEAHSYAVRMREMLAMLAK